MVFMNQIILIFFLLLATVLNAQNMQKIDSLMKRLDIEKTDTTRINLYNQLAWEYRNSDTYLTDSFSTIAITDGIAAKYYVGTGNAYINKAIVFRTGANYKQAIEACRWALVQFLKSKYRLGYASAYNGIANVHFLMGNYSLAQFYFIQSHKISIEIGDAKGIGRALVNMSSVLTVHKEYDKSKQYLEEAVKIFKSLGDESGIAVCWNNIGNIHQMQGVQDTAIAYYRKSMEASRSLGDLKSVAAGLHNIAIVYSESGNNRDALNYYHQSLSIDERLGNIPNIVITHTKIAETYFNLSMYHASAVYVQKALSQALAYDMKTEVMQAYKLLYQIEEKRNRFKEAFEYHKLYKQYSDSIYNEESGSKVNELEEQYLNERIEKQRILATKEEEIMQVRAQEKENAVTQDIFIIGLVLTIFVSFIYIVFFLLRKSKYD